MLSVWYCSLSFMLTLPVLIFLFPNTASGHLGSALKTGSGTLTKFALGDNIIYCTFTNGAEGRPPILSHVRVSREPQTHFGRILFKNDGSEGATDPLLQTSRIKSPSYQHKILQFHSNGQTSSSGAYDYLPLKLITNQYPSTKSLPVYPVASKFGKVGSTSTGSSWNTFDGDEDDDNDSWERYSTSSRWEPNLLEKSDEPKHTPFIGAKALTNIPHFFQHLRDNIQHAIHEKQRALALASNKKEIKGATSLLSSADGSGEEDVDKYSETQDIKIATPTRRGYSSNAETSIAQGAADDGASANMPNRDSRASDLYTLGSQIAKIDDAEPDKRTKELLHFLGHPKQEYPKANNYNPAWLFTNLGLGKRSRSNVGLGDSFYSQ